jgi:hypothetical protein
MDKPVTSAPDLIEIFKKLIGVSDKPKPTKEVEKKKYK